MPCAIYVASYGLAPGHVAGQTFVLDLKFVDLKRPTSSALRAMTPSISGKVESVRFGEARVWGVQLAPIAVIEALNHYEFLRSTEDGQTFTFDPYGSFTTPVQPLQVFRPDEQGYTEDVFQRMGTGGLRDLVTLGFQVREV